MKQELKKKLLESADNSLPVYMRLYHGMRIALERGVLAPGERLPTDMELSHELDVNHLTLKKTLNRLANEGFLTRTRGRGTLVAMELPHAAPFLTGKRIALLLDAVTDATLRSDTFISICKEANGLGLSLELISANSDKKQQFQQILQQFSASDSAGCIVWPIVDQRQLEQLAAARPKGYPLVFINFKPKLDVNGIDFSGFDDFGAGRMLGEHLLEKGYSQVLVCEGTTFKNAPTNVNRISGITVGMNNQPPEVFSKYSDAERNRQPIIEYLNNHPPTGAKAAVVFINEMDYLFCQNLIAQTGWTPFAFFVGAKPICGGVELSSYQMGINAVRILEKRRNGDESFSIVERVLPTFA